MSIIHSFVNNTETVGYNVIVNDLVRLLLYNKANSIKH